MRKTDKKRDNMLREALTEVCGIAREKFDGFDWLTHFVNYNRFPDSLIVVCVYDTSEPLSESDKDRLRFLIKEKLKSIGINLKNIRQHVRFDAQENYDVENKGKGHERFR